MHRHRNFQAIGQAIMAAVVASRCTIFSCDERLLEAFSTRPLIGFVDCTPTPSRVLILSSNQIVLCRSFSRLDEAETSLLGGTSIGAQALSSYCLKSRWSIDSVRIGGSSVQFLGSSYPPVQISIPQQGHSKSYTQGWHTAQDSR